MEQKIVCLDPGHGPDTVNGSPDGIYKEREFTWDMGLRIRRLLEERGVRVLMTRTEDAKPSLTQRAEVSNQGGADLFVSLHSNAAGAGWSDSRGLMIYTSGPGPDAPRNIAARDILARMRAEGIRIWGSGLGYESFTVLVKTTAPAVLIEYAFHTNREDVLLLLDRGYRERLAVATAQGICDFLGVSWREEDRDRPASWAQAAWDKAVAAGILDGTDPHGTVTREMLAVVLDRCGLLDGYPAAESRGSESKKRKKRRKKGSKKRARREK